MTFHISATVPYCRLNNQSTRIRECSIAEFDKLKDARKFQKKKKLKKSTKLTIEYPI